MAPTNPPGEPRHCDRHTPEQTLPAELKNNFQGLHFVGQGANACVYLSDDPPRAIKVSKWPSQPRLWSPRAECTKAQTLHTEACGDADLTAQAEQYFPSCVGGHPYVNPGDDSWLLMHRAGGANPQTIMRLGEGSACKLPPAYQKVVFAQLVSGIRLIHKLGYTHNDLHDGNVMIDLPDFLDSFPWDRHEAVPEPAVAPAVPRLAIIDFGEMVPYANGWKKDYKRDANSLWDRTAFLANCEDHQARWWSTRGSQQGAEAFMHCLVTSWGVDSEFESVMWTVLRASMAESADQHMEELYNTNFVQSHLPNPQHLYQTPHACDAASFLEKLSTAEEIKANTAPVGYDELPGKCSGRWIEVWGDGHFAHYGEDHHISGVADCADTCDQHAECAGFYVKNGKCSHWRSGSVSATPKAGHTCYRKQGGAAPAPAPAHHHHSGGGGHASANCDAVGGYNVAPGKCSGRWIEVWQDGHFAHYGEDHHISSVQDCADTCDQHTDCAGFYTKNGKCSHWRSGSLSARPTAGHCCYSK